MRVIIVLAMGFALAVQPCSFDVKQMIDDNSKFVSLREISHDELDSLIAKHLGATPEINQIHELVAELRFENFVIENNGILASVSNVDIVHGLERNKVALRYADEVKDRWVEFSEITDETFERIVFHYFPFLEAVNVSDVRNLASQLQKYYVVLPFGMGHKSIDTLEIFQALHAINRRCEQMRIKTASEYQRSRSMWTNTAPTNTEDSARSTSLASIE